MWSNFILTSLLVSWGYRQNVPTLVNMLTHNRMGLRGPIGHRTVGVWCNSRYLLVAKKSIFGAKAEQPISRWYRVSQILPSDSTVILRNSGPKRVWQLVLGHEQCKHFNTSIWFGCGSPRCIYQYWRFDQWHGYKLSSNQ